jgi:FSR family fosmidomycin resistance protein-like MFS transporter
LAGGNLADRFGPRRIVQFSMIGSSPFFALFLGTTGWPSMLGLFVGGVILLLTVPVIVVMAQELVPSQAGAVTALMMGFAWGTAGVTFIPMMGWLADRWGLQNVYWGLILLPLLGYLMALKIPPESKAAA